MLFYYAIKTNAMKQNYIKHLMTFSKQWPFKWVSIFTYEYGKKVLIIFPLNCIQYNIEMKINEHITPYRSNVFMVFYEQREY